MSHLLGRSQQASIAPALDYLRTFTDYEQNLPADAHRTFDLERVRRLLAKLSDPHLHRPSVHVTGTKGKGSAVHFADAILRAHGVRTFRFLSPHVERLNERIAIAGIDVTDERLAASIAAIRPTIDETRTVLPAETPTFFEVMSVLGFMIARESGADADVVEVGLGGRLDATNVIDSTVSVITSIDLDHTRILGTTRARIAAEKAGIIKPAKPVLVGLERDDPACEVILARARALGSHACWVGGGVIVGPARYAMTRRGRPGVRFGGAIGGLIVDDAVVPGGGLHQATNALLALGSAAKVLEALDRPLRQDAALEALESTELPARAELFEARVPVLLDGAHTGKSCAALVDLVRWLWPDRTIVLLGGLTRERSVRSLFAPFLKVTDRAVFVPLPTPRSADPAGAAAEWRSLGGTAVAEKGAIEGLDRAFSAAGPRGAVVVAGSFYLAGALRPALRNGV